MALPSTVGVAVAVAVAIAGGSELAVAVDIGVLASGVVMGVAVALAVVVACGAVLACAVAVAVEMIGERVSATAPSEKDRGERKKNGMDNIVTKRNFFIVEVSITP